MEFPNLLFEIVGFELSSSRLWKVAIGSLLNTGLLQTNLIIKMCDDLQVILGLCIEVVCSHFLVALWGKIQCSMSTFISFQENIKKKKSPEVLKEETSYLRELYSRTIESFNKDVNILCCHIFVWAVQICLFIYVQKFFHVSLF